MKFKKIILCSFVFVFIFIMFSCSNTSSSQKLSSIVDVSDIKNISISRLIDSAKQVISDKDEIKEFVETYIDDVKWTDEEEKVNLVLKEFDSSYDNLNISFNLNHNSVFSITTQQEGYAYLNINDKKYTIDGEDKLDYNNIFSFNGK